MSTSRQVAIVVHLEGSDADLAIARLREPALPNAQRYNRYRDTDGIGKVFTWVDFGPRA